MITFTSRTTHNNKSILRGWKKMTDFGHRTLDVAIQLLLIHLSMPPDRKISFSMERSIYLLCANFGKIYRTMLFENNMQNDSVTPLVVAATILYCSI